MTRKKPTPKSKQRTTKKATAAKKKAAPGKGSRRSKLAFIHELIAKTREKLSASDAKATVGDLIRLIQMEDELEERQPKEVKVRWIDPPQDKNSNG